MSERSTYFYFVMKDGLELRDMKDNLIDFSREAAGADNLFLADYNASIAREIAVDMERGATQIDLEFTLDNNLEKSMWFGFDISYRLGMIAVEYNFFRQEETVFLFLHFCKAFYQSFHPLYGGGIREPTDLPDVSLVDAGKIETLYTYNFLGPAMVAAYGREKLHSVPAWQIEDLPDGGLFIGMIPNPFENWEKDIPAYEKTAEILGIARYEQQG